MSIRVRKGNKILKISEDAIDRYMSQGYSVIDETGTVVNKATPVDTTTLKMEYSKMSDEIDSLKSTIEELEGTIEGLNADIKALTDDNTYLKQENKKLTKELTTLKSTPISEKPTTTRKRKQATLPRSFHLTSQMPVSALTLAALS